MTIRPQPLADVTYRATVAGNREAELRLRMPLAAASAADGWARLSAVFAGVDPMTMEIEIREIVEPRPWRRVARPPRSCTIPARPGARPRSCGSAGRAAPPAGPSWSRASPEPATRAANPSAPAALNRSPAVGRSSSALR
jgi:hypothetical protein